MSQTPYEQIIAAGIKHLSRERQREVADFVLFLREREAGDAKYEQLIEADLAKFSKEESKHLEEEFADYDRLYPRR